MPLSIAGDAVADTIMLALGVILDAGPFLLLGALGAGLVEIFVPDGDLARLSPRGRALAVLLGIGLGMVFPVGQSGAVPLVRRLVRKGLPTAAATAFLLAAPVLNPLMLASLGAALGWGALLVVRVAGGLLLAIIAGLAASVFWPGADAILRTERARQAEPSLDEPAGGVMRAALRVAGDEFVALGPYLVIGALLAAMAQTLVSTLPALDAGLTGPAAVLVAQVLAFANAGSPLADAQAAAQLASFAPAGAVAAFLVSGAVVDIKNVALYLAALQGRLVLLITVLAVVVAFAVSLLAAPILGVL